MENLRVVAKINKAGYNAVKGMNIAKCDKCKKNKKEKTSWVDKDTPWVNGSVRGCGLYCSFDLCGKRGKGFVSYTKKFFGIKED